MNSALQIDQMTVEDKIRTMEDLWDSLCRNTAHIHSPTWHHDALAERDQSIHVGEAVFEEWGSAKKKIRESLS